MPNIDFLMSNPAIGAALFTPTLLAFGLAILFVQVFRRMALQHGVLLDKPCDYRKFHKGAIPLVGGLAVFMAVGISSLAASPLFSEWVVLTAGAALLVLGSLDDHLDISAKRKLMWQMIIVTGAVSLSDRTIPELFANQETNPALYAAACFLVVTGIVAYLNAVNMTDGADGLAGGVMLITSIALAISCAELGETGLANMLTVLSGGMLGFLLFNFRRPGLQRAQVFMGDAGALSYGFFLAWCATAVANHSLPAVLWLMAYPLLDLTSVAIRRMAAGKSPFHADRNHLHHVLLDSGLSHSGMIAVVLGLNAAFSAMGVLGLTGHLTNEALTVGFMLLVVTYLLATSKIVKS